MHIGSQFPSADGSSDLRRGGTVWLTLIEPDSSGGCPSPPARRRCGLLKSTFRARRRVSCSIVLPTRPAEGLWLSNLRVRLEPAVGAEDALRAFGEFDWCVAAAVAPVHD